MLGDRQKLDMGEAGVDDIGDQPFRQFVPGQEAAILVALPRTGMDLIDGDGLAPRFGFTPELAMRGIAPFVPRGRRRHRGGGRAQFRAEGEGVGLERQARAPRPNDLVFIGAALAKAGNEDFPDAGVLPQPHRMAAAVPGIEIADHGDPLGIGRPDGEMHAAGAFMVDEMRTQLVEQAQMRTLRHVIIVHRTEHRAEGVWVGDPPFAARIAGMVFQRLTPGDRDWSLEEPGLVAAKD